MADAVSQIRLGNGMRALLVPCEAESVAFGLFVGSGSRHETARTAGISHLIEHMLFKGTRRRSPLEISRAIEGRGGNFNAYTGEESTVYYTHMPFEYLGESVDILSDMYLHAQIPDGEFEREKQVVVEEIRMYADEPDSVAMENLQRCLFPGNALGLPVAGSEASLRPMRADDLRRYVRRHYRADNTVAVVVGRFDPARARDLLERKLGTARLGRRRGAEGTPVDMAVPPVGEIVVTKAVQQVQFALGYRTFGINDRRKYAITVFDAVMGRGMSSRLFQEVRERRGLSYDIASRMQFFDDAGMWNVAAGVDPAKADRILPVVERELAKVAARRIGEVELRRTKEFLVGNFRMGHERLTSKMFYYGSAMLAFDRVVPTKEQIDGVMAVTAEDVRGVAEMMLDERCRAISWVRPAVENS